ncbi:MAG TPA: hypothetical protein VGV89_05670 [Thermoplasmata archaeon]|nr:hypothetical protein [Thermoplasmata archaeon]
MAGVSDCRFVQAYRYGSGLEPVPERSETCAGLRELVVVRSALAPTLPESFPLCERHREMLLREIGVTRLVLPA